MQKIYLLLFSLFLFTNFALQAQEVYLDAQYGVTVMPDQMYGSNISILTGTPAPLDLMMDVYMPEGDNNTARPVVLVAHTGSFLPPLFNGGITGARSDSTVVNICSRLAARGYVAVAFTYRAGWLPTSPDENTRRGTLLQAAYRGIQDARSCVRHMRKTAAVDGNPYGIDPDRIAMLGVGTGSYIAYGCGSLYDFEEVLLEKFIDTNSALPYIDSTVFGNLYGDTQAALCLANTPGYSSEIDFSFAFGGACGDISWIDGNENEAAFSGVHCTQDIFAPYGDGPVIVPTTNEFVVNVSGNRTAVAQANEQGNNDVLNDPTVALWLQSEIDAQKEVDVDPALSAPIKMGVDHFYGFNLAFPQGSPWDWWDKATLDLVVAGTNAALGTNFNSDTLHLSGLITNPNMSAEQGKAYIDTAMMIFLPRACLAMELGCNLPVNTTEIQADLVQLEMYPNPASSEVNISVKDAVIENVYIYSLDGKLVKALAKLNDNKVSLLVDDMKAGVYATRITTDKGTLTKELVIY